MEEILGPGRSKKEKENEEAKNEEKQLVILRDVLRTLHWSFGSPGKGC
jgi:hypothetical protein